MTGMFPNVGQAEIDAVKRLSHIDSEQLKANIRACYPHKIFTPAGNSHNTDKCKIICPNCGNGTGHDATPVEVTYQNGVWLYNCLRCNDFQGDLLKIIATDEHLNLRDQDDLCRALAIGANLIGYPLFADNQARKNFKPAQQVIKNTSQPKTEDAIKDEKILKLVHADIAEAQAHIQDLPKDQMRGLTPHTMIHFGFGYIPNWTHPNCRLDGIKVPTSKRIIISTPNHYNAVALPADRPKMNKQYHKMHAGKMELFNAAALTDERDLIIVTEGEIDAASIWQAFEEKISVVAVLGAGNYQKTLLPLLSSVKDKKFLILFDADEAGRKAAKNLRGELVKRGFRAACRFYYDAITNKLENGDKNLFPFDTKVDANQILQSKDKYFLRTLTEEIISSARIELADHQTTIIDEKKRNDTMKETRHMDETTKRNLDKAIIWLENLKPENLTAEEIYSKDNLHAVALAFAHGYLAQAKNFSDAIKAAKKLARNRIAESKSGLIKELSQDEKDALDKIINISETDIKKYIERETTVCKNAHEAFIREEIQKKAREEQAAEQARRDANLKTCGERLAELKAMPPSPERDAELIQVINNLCEWVHNKHGNPVKVKATARNIRLIFENDPNLEQLFGFDEFQQADVLLKAPPWRPHAKKGDEWSDRDDAQLQMYMRETYTEFANKDLTLNAITSFSDANSFHEVKDYFHNLPKWDGKPRAETFFVDWLGVADSKYAREVTMKWLTAAVARIFHPGCEFQWALVLHGKQKIGKGYVLKRLGGNWYQAISDRVDDPHAVDTIKLVWIGEFKEMNGMRKADVNAIKNFIELPADTRRFAYGRRAKTVPRHCVFAITVNDDNFLSDLTGNRRFLILKSNLPMFGYISEVRGEKLSDDNVIAQIWAEVYEHYKKLFQDGFDEKKLELSSETEHMGEEIANTYLNDNGLTGEIKAFLDRKILPKVIWDSMTREEHRTFIAEGKFAIARRDLEARFKNSSKKISAKRQAEFDAAISASDSVLLVEIRDKLTGESVPAIEFFGSEYRQHICAAEINSEAFMPNDKRKSVMRIHEILNNIEGWHLGQRLQKDPVYGDQKNVFYRDEDNNPDDDNDNDDNDNDDNNNNDNNDNNDNKTIPTTNKTPQTIEDEFNGKPLDGTEAMPDFDLSQWD